ncbi:Proton-dependent oligopeptide transporter family [Cynara cardunculus var. scolymus]|uniref:Proton-dependent oligopeptide transporter family n=1 Tax=Cynara cardunculus var. scolymus TaxID=59895 RepID=A0A103YL95_CYNCS|nr:Proton-dependent oligopeptide transporter family [Cynara cardunculus var. scolymus]
MAIAAVENNLMTYVINEMHISCLPLIYIGFILLSVQAHLLQLKPPKCNMLVDGDQCTTAKGMKALILYLSLYLVALGRGCVKPNMLAHGANQFNKADSKQCKQLSRYFSSAYLFGYCSHLRCLDLNPLGYDTGFRVSAIVMAMGLIC